MEAHPRITAFIDSQNIHRGVLSLGWKLDWRRFRVFLTEKYRVDTAYVFVGFVPSELQLYETLSRAGFRIVYRPVLSAKPAERKGNVDVDLVMRVMAEHGNYDKAVIATSDGDFYSLVVYLYQSAKLEAVLSPSSEICSLLIKQSAKERLHFLNDRKSELQYEGKNERPPRRDGTRTSDLAS